MFNRKPKTKTSSILGSRESLDSKASSGKSPYSSNENMRENTNILNRTMSFTVAFIGVLEYVRIIPSLTEDSESLLLEKIENAQVDGKLPVKASEDVTIVLSKHGVRITAIPISNHVQEVKWRFPLHSISQLIKYESTTGKFNIILKIGQVGKVIYDCYVMQCQNQDQSQAICNSLQAIFNMLAQKS